MPIPPRLFAFTAILIASTLAAHADTVVFTLTPAAGASGSNVDAFSFTAPLSPTNSVDASSNSFTLPASDLSGTFDGGTLVATEVTFDSNGLLIGNDLFVAPAATIYSGDPNMPTFNTGTFDILEYDNVNHNLIGEGTLTITDPSTIGQGPSPTPTPEPSTIALFGTGILGPGRSSAPQVS